MCRSFWSRGLSVLAVSLAFLAVARAGVIRNLNAPGIQYTSIQAAVDAAANGDVLFITQGLYPAFTIDGKSLTLVAMPNAAVTVTGTIRIRNVPAGGEVDLIGVSANAAQTGVGQVGAPAMLLTDNAGHVRVADGAFNGASAFSGIPGGERGGTGIWISASPRVVLIRCTVRGGAGNRNVCILPPFSITYAGDGGDGVYTQVSTLSIHGGNFRGGDGGAGEGYGGNAGTGLYAVDQKFLAAGGSFLGGIGGSCTGYDECLWSSGNGGNGIYVGSGPSEILGVSSLGGPPGIFWWPAGPGWPGTAFAGPGSYTFFPGSARSISTQRIAADATPIPIVVAGVPGELALCAASPLSVFTFMPLLRGTWLIDNTGFSSRRSFIGTIGAGGTAALSFVTAPLVAPERARRTTVQCLLVTPGQKHLSDPVVQVLIDRAAAPDCNANGTNDFLDIALGTSLDVNANLIPDECGP